MGEFWVRKLVYELEPQDAVSYENCPAVEFKNNLGSFRLENGTLTVSLEAKIDSREQARAAVDRVLAAWDVQHRLTHWAQPLTFKYRSSEVESKVPPPPGNHVIHVEPATMVITAGSVRLHITRHSYPAPPERFAMSADVQTLWGRYEQYMLDREPLLSMANFVCTYVRGCDDERNCFGSSRDVRRHLGRLATHRGDALTARKAPLSTPLTPEEENWIRTAVVELIRRAGEYAAGGTPRPLTMADLPKLL